MNSLQITAAVTLGLVLFAYLALLWLLRRRSPLATTPTTVAKPRRRMEPSLGNDLSITPAAADAIIAEPRCPQCGANMQQRHDLRSEQSHWRCERAPRCSGQRRKPQ